MHYLPGDKADGAPRQADGAPRQADGAPRQADGAPRQADGAPLAAHASDVDVQRLGPAELTPRQIVEYLDLHVIGQAPAKRAIAVAMRNRLRRQAVGPPLGGDITPRNILMIGPTGVGKTEIARRIARLTSSPFVKVEASKYTEVGYVGRDVESMIRDLVAVAVQQVRAERESEVAARAEERADERVVDLLVPSGGSGLDADAVRRRRDTIRTQLKAGRLDDRTVEIEVVDAPPGISIFGGQGPEGMDVDLSSLFPGMPRRTKRKSVTVAEARGIFRAEESGKLLDDEAVKRTAIERVEASGIVFLDEIDKVAGREGGRGPDVSREGVQRDLLPIVEGTTVQTRWGAVRTDHVLFIAAGAFHVSKPADLIPELQGRFPVRVELSALGKDELARILTEPASSLTKQATALMLAEGVDLRFTPDGVEALADFAARVNAATEDIGARRLATVLETVLEETSFVAPEIAGTTVVVDAAVVTARLADIVRDQDYTRYVL